jgi:hypothetical protein
MKDKKEPINIQFTKHFLKLSKDLKEDDTGLWRYEAEKAYGKPLNEHEVQLLLNNKLS